MLFFKTSPSVTVESVQSRSFSLAGHNDFKHQLSNHSLASKKSQASSSTTLQHSFTSSFRAIVNDFYRFQCDTWAFEILCLVVSIAVLVLAGFTLYYYDGKPYPEWPYSFTLNAFISVCMTVVVATLTVPISSGIGQLKWILARKGDVSVMDLDTLDRASRGMWGSLCALFTFTGGCAVPLRVELRSY